MSQQNEDCSEIWSQLFHKDIIMNFYESQNNEDLKVIQNLKLNSIKLVYATLLSFDAYVLYTNLFIQDDEFYKKYVYLFFVLIQVIHLIFNDKWFRINNYMILVKQIYHLFTLINYSYVISYVTNDKLTFVFSYMLNLVISQSLFINLIFSILNFILLRERFHQSMTSLHFFFVIAIGYIISFIFIVNYQAFIEEQVEIQNQRIRNTIINQINTEQIPKINQIKIYNKNNFDNLQSNQPDYEQLQSNIKQIKVLLKQQKLYQNGIQKYMLIQNKKIYVQIQHCNIDDIMKKIIIIYEKQCRAKNIVLRYDKDRFCFRLRTDKKQVEYIICNLIDNSLKHTVNGEILITFKPFQCLVLVTVQDNGFGIEKEHLKEILKPYKSFKHLKSQSPKGLGLGLYICDNIAYQLSFFGNLRIHSEVDIGTQVSFLIESQFSYHLDKYFLDDYWNLCKDLFITFKNQQHSQRYQQAQRNQRQIDRQIQINKQNQENVPIIQNQQVNRPAEQQIINTEKQFKILIVDDIISNITGLKHLISNIQLQNIEIILIQAYDGVEAVEKFETLNFCKSERNIKMIITDLNMTRMNGDILCKNIKNLIRLGHVECVLVGFLGENQQQDTEKFQSVEVFEYLDKPTNIVQVKTLIRKYAENQNNAQN